MTVPGRTAASTSWLGRPTVATTSASVTSERMSSASVAPARSNTSSGKAAAVPAPRWMRTAAPDFTNLETVSGTSATLRSFDAASRGTATIIGLANTA